MRGMRSDSVADADLRYETGEFVPFQRLREKIGWIHLGWPFFELDPDLFEHFS